MLRVFRWLDDRFFRQPTIASFGVVVLIALLFGFTVTFSGTHFWDDVVRYRHSLNILASYGLGDTVASMTGYGALWELFLGLQTEYFMRILRSPYWVRHAWNVCLYVSSLYAVYALLLQVGYRRVTAALCTVLIFGIIRLGGHALFNPKDMPAAMIYVVVTIALWLLFKRVISGDLRPKILIALGLVSVVPFLLRVPLLLHAAITLGLLVLWASVGAHHLSVAQRMRLVLLPILSASVAIFAFSPAVWQRGVIGLIEISRGFAGFRWTDTISVFGASVSYENVPWWYPFPWPLVHTEPITFIVLLAGLILSVIWRNQQSRLELRTSMMKVHVTFEAWVALVLLLSCLAFISIRPVVYHEERHIFFLYPLLALLGGLGFAHTRLSLQRGLATLCLLLSLVTYARWGIYSYVYTSPLASAFGYTTNDGDFYGSLCIQKGVNMLPDLIPPETLIYTFPIQNANLQDLHLRYRRFFPRTDFPHYTFVRDLPTERPFVVLRSIHAENFGGAADLTIPGSSTLLWSDHLPTGELTCSLTLYE